MSESVFPATRGSLRWHVGRAAFSARLVAALLSAATAVRFAWTGVDQAFAFSQANSSENPSPRASVSAAPSVPRRTAPPPRKPPPAPRPKDPAAASRGKPVRLSLGVSYGPSRSDVYVNGQRVGQSPFLGDASCKGGENLRIEVVPPKGPPLTYVRPCYPGAVLTIDGPPP